MQILQNSQAAALISAILKAERELAANKRRLEDIRHACAHKWSDPLYTPDIREAYTDPGDAPGTMGVDWRGPCHVPRQETPKWTRVCSCCGKTEVTTRTVQQVKQTPQF